MTYRIEQEASQRERFGEYTYRIYCGDGLIAYYWHDHRGDDHGIKFLNGVAESWPVGSMTDFLEGGGPKPLKLTAAAISYLRQRGA